MRSGSYALPQSLEGAGETNQRNVEIDRLVPRCPDAEPRLQPGPEFLEHPALKREPGMATRRVTGLVEELEWRAGINLKRDTRRQIAAQRYGDDARECARPRRPAEW